MSYYSNIKAQAVQRLRDTEIVLAVRHHRRALDFLQSVTFEQLPSATTLKLVDDLTSGLNLLETELERRNLAPSMVEAGSEQSVGMNIPINNQIPRNL